jgi:hypothetical protein
MTKTPQGATAPLESTIPYADRPFTVAQVVRNLGYSRAYVNKLMRTGKLGYSKVGSRVTIRGRDITKLLDDAAVAS